MPPLDFLKVSKCTAMLFALPKLGRGPGPQRCSSLAWSSKWLKEEQRSAEGNLWTREAGSNSPPPSQQFDQNGPRDALAHLFRLQRHGPIWFEPTHWFCSLLFLLNSLVHSGDHLQIKARVSRGFWGNQPGRNAVSHVRSASDHPLLSFFNITHFFLC